MVKRKKRIGRRKKGRTGSAQTNEKRREMREKHKNAKSKEAAQAMQADQKATLVAEKEALEARLEALAKQIAACDLTSLAAPTSSSSSAAAAAASSSSSSSSSSSTDFDSLGSMSLVSVDEEGKRRGGKRRRREASGDDHPFRELAARVEGVDGKAVVSQLAGHVRWKVEPVKGIVQLVEDNRRDLSAAPVRSVMSIWDEHNQGFLVELTINGRPCRRDGTALPPVPLSTRTAASQSSARDPITRHGRLGHGQRLRLTKTKVCVSVVAVVSLLSLLHSRSLFCLAGLVAPPARG